MGIIVRQSIKNAVYSYLGVALGFISTILLFPNILSADQFGLTRVLISIALVSSQFSHLGMKNTIIRYFPYFKDSTKSRYHLLFFAVTVAFAGFLIFLLLFLLFKSDLIRYYTDKSELFDEFYFYLLPLVFAILFYEVLNTYVRALKDSVVGSFVNEVLVRILVIALLVTYYFTGMSFSQFMLLFTLVYGVQPLYMLVYLYLRDELKFYIPSLLDTRNLRLAREMGVYSTYALLGGLTTMLVGNIDIIMLGSMTNLASTAVYTIAFYVGSVIAIPKRSIDKIALPVLADFLKQKKYDELESLYKSTSLNQLIAGSLLLVGVWANIHNLNTLLPSEYADIKWIIVVVGLAKLFDMATGINGSIILNSRFYKFDFYFSVFLVVLTIATNYILIPPLGILGAAIATAISIFINHTIKFIFVWIKFDMQPFRWNALAVLAIAGGCLLMSFQIPYLANFFVDVIVRSIAIAAVFLGLILVFNLSDDISRLVSRSVEQIKRYLGPEK